MIKPKLRHQPLFCLWQLPISHRHTRISYKTDAFLLRLVSVSILHQHHYHPYTIRILFCSYPIDPTRLQYQLSHCLHYKPVTKNLHPYKNVPRLLSKVSGSCLDVFGDDKPRTHLATSPRPEETASRLPVVESANTSKNTVRRQTLICLNLLRVYHIFVRQGKESRRYQAKAVDAPTN